MPAETPAAVTYLPAKTTRRWTDVTPNARSWSSASQCEVACRPRSRPAAARMSEPVQTEVVQVLAWSADLSHSWAGPSVIWLACPGPPGTTTMPGRGSCASVASAASRRPPLSAATGPACSAVKTTRAPGRWLNTS
jgi:hypothetical protein